MDFETVTDAALRLNVTNRTIQKWAKQGKLKGSIKHGNSWMILKNALPDTKDTASHIPFPLLRASFPVGKALEYVNSIEDDDDKTIALGEYYLFSGNFEKTIELCDKYINTNDVYLSYSARVLLVFANVLKGHIQAAKSLSEIMIYKITDDLNSEASPEFKAFLILITYIGSVLVKQTVPKTPPLEEYLHYLPNGLRLFGCYLLAFKAYREKNYIRTVSVCETAISMCNSLYPVAAAFSHMITAAGYISMMDIENAKKHFNISHKLYYPDKFFMLTGIHYRYLQGLLESCIKNDFPNEYSEVMYIAKNFSHSWIKLHMHNTDNLLHSLSSIELSICYLYGKGWQKKEIASYLGVSVSKVKKHIQIIYETLNVQTKSELTHYLQD